MALNLSEKKELKEEIQKEQYFGLIQREKALIEEKNKSQNLLRLLQLEKTEQEGAQKKQNTTEFLAYRERSLEQEETLAREFDKLRNKEVCLIRERQRLRENSQELKELETKLKNAYARRELRAQMAENEEKKRLEKLKLIEDNKVFEEARVNDAEYDKYLKQKELNKKHEYRKELQDQIILKDKMKRCKYEEFLREKKIIDQIVQRIHEEDERYLQEKWLRMQKTKEEMESFKKAQEIWKKRQREQVELENQKIQEYLYTKQSVAQVELANKMLKDEAREAMVEKIATQIFEEKNRQKEREEIQQELMERERLEAVDMREQKDIENRFRSRIEMVKGLDEQIKDLEIRRKQIAEEDVKYKQFLQKSYEEEQKSDMLTADKRRIKKMQLRKDLEELITERRRKHVENMQILLKLHEQELEELAERNAKIEEERIRMLKEHAEHLIGYMPKGILREDDLPLLGTKVYETYKSTKQDE